MATLLANGLGFNLEIKHAAVVFGDTSETEICVLPPNSYIVDIKVDVQTAFSGGSGILDIGKSGDADYFANDIDVSGTGRATVTLTEAAENLGDRPVTLVAQAVGSDTAGACTIMVTYFCLTHSHLH